MKDWSPSLYRRFEDERTRPARDLLAQVDVEAPQVVVDMGCGPGNSTELLVEQFPGAQVVGLDTSPNMLAEARERVPGARFDVADANTWVPEAGTGVVFANAIYQWVPGHMAALTRVLAALEPGAALAVQMPDNINEPSHAAMRQVAAEGPWAERLKDAARAALPPVRAYHEALAPYAERLDIWHTTCSPMPMRWSNGSRARDCARSSIRWTRRNGPSSWPVIVPGSSMPIRRWPAARCCCGSRAFSSWRGAEPRATGRRVP